MMTLVLAAATAPSTVYAIESELAHDTAGVLTLEITGTPDPARISERVTMELLACNSGDTEATGVVISGVVPAGLAFATVTDGGSCSAGGCGPGSTITWNLDSIGANRCRTVHLSMAVVAGTLDGTEIAFTFEMDVDGGGSVSDTFTVTVDSTSALAVEIADDADPVAGGDIIHYSVAYGNRSVANVLSGSLTAQVPVGTTLVSIEDGGTEAGGTITWPLGTISAGESGRRRFSVTVDDPALDGSAIVAEAAVTGTGESARATQGTAIVAAETLRIHFSAHPEVVGSGGRSIFDLTICNAGDTEATGVVVDSMVPEGIAFPSATDGATCSAGGCGASARLSWVLAAALPAGRCRVLTVSWAEVGVNSGELFRPVYRVSADGGAQAWATRTISLDNQRRFLLALGDDRDPVEAGETLTYTLTFGNFSAENALSASLRAWVPKGTALFSIDGDGVEADGVITWPLGTLRAGESGQRRFTVTVDAGASDGTAIDALAQLDIDSGATLGTSASQTTMVNGEQTLTVRTTGHPDPVLQSARVLFDLTVCNSGGDEAIGVVLDAIVPDGFAFARTLDGGTCSAGGCGGSALLSWNVGDLAAGRCRTIPISQANTFASDGSPIAFSVRAKADNRQMAVAQRTVVGDRTPSLVVGLVDDRDPVAPGGDLIFTVAASNRSAENVTASTLRFFVPAGTTLVSVADGGTEAGGVVTWDLGTMAAGDAVQRRVVVTVDSALADGSSVVAEAELTGGSTERFAARATQATSVVSAEVLTLDLVPHFEPTRVNDSIYLDLVACNRGPVDATGVLLEQIVPNFLAFARSAEASASCNAGGCGAGSTITWDVGELLAGRCRTIGMTTLVTGASVGDLVVPTARIIADGGSVATAARIVAANTALPLTSFIREEADPVAPATDTSFELVFGNRSDSTFSDGQLRVAIPQGATVVSASTGAVLDGDELSWNLCPMSAGQSAKYTYTVALDDGTALPDGTALVTDVQFAALDGNPPASHAAASTAVVAAAPLSLQIETSAADIVKAGDVVAYDLTACNDGAGQATGVVIRMFPPRGMTTSAIDDGGAANAAGEIVWDVDAINATECATVGASFTVTAGGGYVGDGTVIFASARLLVDGGETATATHALRACSTTVASCTVRPPPPCGAPQSRACNRTASDALAILRTAVGLRECPLCECDIDGSNSITASDALGTLRFSVGQAVALRCPSCLPEE